MDQSSDAEPEPFAEPGAESYVRQLYVAVVVLWILLIVCGNVWMVMGSLKARLHQSDSLYIYVISIAVSSIVIAVLVLPVHVLNYADLLNMPICKLCEFNLLAATGGNVGSQFTAAYYQWRQEGKDEKRPMKHHIRCLSAIWFVAVLYATRQLAIVGYITPQNGTGSCAVDLPITTARFVLISDFMVLGVVPCLLIIFFTVITMLQAKTLSGIFLLGSLLVLFILLTFPARIFDLIVALQLVDGSVLSTLSYALMGLSFAFEWVSIGLVLALDKATRNACFKLLGMGCCQGEKVHDVNGILGNEKKEFNKQIPEF